ncbi:MAG TPA: basic amino acid ABC transporter substrate-binding protein [Bacillota bacterium]|nr:basic amino acid ABC transporter substrate-binding protein [Bacillota bacterium]
MKKILKLAVSGLLVIGLTAGLAGCGGAKEEAKTAEPAAKKTVTIATNAAFAPYEYQDPKTGELTGFDMELIREIGKIAGFEVEIKNMGFDGVIQAVASKQVDGAISGMTITDDRKKMFNFSDPYINSDQSIAVLAANDTMKTEKDLENKRLVAQIGTTGAIKAKSIKGATVKELDTIDLAFMELKNGKADAVVNDLPVSQNYISKGNSDVKISGIIKTNEQYGIAFNKDNTELLNKVNAALKTMKENGKYNELYKKWFGTEPQQ